MQTSIRHSTKATARNGDFLSLDDMRRAAPAIFAESAHESRSSRYGFIPTERMISGLMAEGFQPVSVQQANSRTEGKELAGKHLIRFRHAGTHQVNDVFPEVVLLNSHDGSSSYQLMSGMFRLVCLNGLITCAGEQDSIKILHKANALDQVIEGSYSIIEKAPAILDAMQEMQSVDLNREERTIFNRAALALRYENEEASPINPSDLERVRRTEDVGPDLWRTFNRTQENIIQGGLNGFRTDANGRRKQTRTREIKGIDQTVSLNRGLWILAEEMRKLKAA